MSDSGDTESSSSHSSFTDVEEPSNSPVPYCFEPSESESTSSHSSSSESDSSDDESLEKLKDLSW